MCLIISVLCIINLESNQLVIKEELNQNYESQSYYNSGKDKVWFTSDDKKGNLHGAYHLSYKYFQPEGISQEQIRGKENRIKMYYSAQIVQTIRDEQGRLAQEAYCTVSKDVENEIYKLGTECTELITVEYGPDIAYIKIFNHPGLDSIWNTNDDQMEYYVISKESEKVIMNIGYMCAKLPCLANQINNMTLFSYCKKYDREAKILFTFYDLEGRKDEKSCEIGSSFLKNKGVERITTGNIGNRDILHIEEVYDSFLTQKYVKRIKIVINKLNLLTLVAIYSGYGPDKIWNTQDDRLAGYAKYIYSNNQGATLLEAIQYVNMLPRGLDKYIYIVFKMQANGPSKLSGEDKIPFTDDDIDTTAIRYSYSDNGKLQRKIYYKSNGNDGIMFTDDDIVDGYEIFEY